MSKVDIQHAVDVLSNLAQSEGDAGYEYWMNIINLLKQPPAVPDGYALVPVELNTDQVFMIKDTMQVESIHLTTWFITEMHKAILAAAKGGAE
jgi:hypothetical protein